MSVDTKAPAPRHARIDALPADLKVTQLGVIRSEWLKFWSLRSTWFSLAAAVLGMIGLDCMFAYGAVTRFHRLQEIRPGAALDFHAVDTAMRGYLLVQLVVGVLGVLIVSGEYRTGMIRSSLAAAPRRLPVVWGKAIVVTVVTFVLTTISAFIAYFAVQPILDSAGLGYQLTAPGVVRAVFGTGLYAAGIALFGLGLGWILRHTAAAIATLFGIVLILPQLVGLLPDSWQPHLLPYLLSEAGGQVVSANPDPAGLSPWTGFAVMCVWAAVAIALGAVLLRRRDA